MVTRRALLGAAAMLCAAGAADQNLIRTATKLSSTAGWSGFVLYNPSYHWLNSHELLFFREDPRHQGDWTLYRLDVKAHKEQKLTALSRLFHDSGSGLGDVRPSPDGKWLLWSGQFDGNPNWYIAKLDGTKEAHWLRRRVGGFASAIWNVELWSYSKWTPDSANIVESQFDFAEPNLIVSSWIRRVSSPAAEHALVPITVSALHFDPWPPEVVSSDRFLMLIPNNDGIDPWARTTVLLWRDGQTKPAVSVSDPMFPQGSDICACLLSPQRDRILWMVDDAPLNRILMDGDKMPQLIAGHPTQCQLWITSVNGGRKQLIGTIKYQSGKESEQYAHFGGFAWLPDGRSVSFIYYGDLYMVAVR
jgi:hypothetical protein